jgi:C_GCAxxG_C_C family probable redox protein
MKSKTSTDLAQQAYQRAFTLDIEYGCCPQCVLTAVKETSGFVTDEIIKASHGLSGGGGLTGDGACGALSGGLVALSARYGRDADKLNRGRGMANFNVTRELVERFRREFGGTSCEQLQIEFTGRSWDMWDPTEYKTFCDERGDKCAHATGLVTKWVVEYLNGK